MCHRYRDCLDVFFSIVLSCTRFSCSLGAVCKLVLFGPIVLAFVSLFKSVPSTKPFIEAFASERGIIWALFEWLVDPTRRGRL